MKEKNFDDTREEARGNAGLYEVVQYSFDRDGNDLYHLTLDGKFSGTGSLAGMQKWAKHMESNYNNSFWKHHRNENFDPNRKLQWFAA